VVVVAGEAVTEEPVVEDKPVDGAQLYVPPPDAVKVADSPAQIFPLDVTVIVPLGIIVTIAEEVAVHPPASVPVTE
jgi:hypothetical protein